MQISDEKLYELCKKYGFQAKLWRQKFIGLLPEVNKRKLYERKRFEDKPVLKKMLENGEASINKLTRIVSIATPENEEELAKKIKVLPRNALETLVRDEKYAQNKNSNMQIFEGNFKDENGLQKPLFELADDVKEELNQLNSKGIDVNELLREMLKKRREEIAKKKEEIAASLLASENIKSTVSRYIPVQIKKIIKEEYGEKCSISTCQKPAEIIHHTSSQGLMPSSGRCGQRFSLSQNHDPRFIAPLCREHHAIAHSIDLKYHKVRHMSSA